MQPPPPRGPGAGALLLAFVAGALGGAAAASLVSPRGATGGDDSGEELRRSIASLERTVRTLGEELASSRRAPATGRLAGGEPPIEPLTPAGEDGQDFHDLVAVSQLIARLDAIAQRLDARAGGAGGYAGAELLPPLDATRPPSDRSALLALATEENDQRQVWRRHAFWTCQQVLDAYGLPDQIEAGDGFMGWYYDTGERTVHFVFHEGMLVNFWN